MILSGKTIWQLSIITPHVPRTRTESGLSYGESYAGYDIRLGSQAVVYQDVTLATSLEHFSMPVDVVGVVHDKSSWARRGLFVQNTIIEPGWRGYLTLELTWNTESNYSLTLEAGTPIAQVVFHRVDRPTLGYAGPYQDQEQVPTPSKMLVNL